MTGPNHNVAASVRQRLLNRARATHTDYNQLLIRYAIERLLYRLSLSRHGSVFILKGAMLFAIWEGSMHRPTQDLDLLGYGERSTERLIAIFREICAIDAAAEDGLHFDAESVRAEEIRTTDDYGGIRVVLTANIGGAVLRLQVDVGFGDAVTPPAAEVVYPSLLDELPAAKLRVYPRETVVAEELEAITKLGMLNTRFKDYYDLHYLCRTFDFDGTVLADAIKATFLRRGTSFPPGLPIGLTVGFALDSVKQVQWSAFCRRLGERPSPDSLSQVIDVLAAFAALPLLASAHGERFGMQWKAPGPWAVP